MARINKRAVGASVETHEGAPAYPHLNPLQQLRRSVLACFLWENTFYEDGVAIADRIAAEATAVTPEELAALAVEARTRFNLRHVPLLLLSVLAKRGSGRPDGLVRKTIEQVISRADELAEFLAIYWKDGRSPLSGQVKKGLAQAFRKFDAYSLGKYNRDDKVKLRDVLFLSHAKGKDETQNAVFHKLAQKTLESPDTWEMQLSAGADKRETFERLIQEGKLGYFALIRNLRNMVEAGVDKRLVSEAILRRQNGADKLLPYRFITAAMHAPQFETELDDAMAAASQKILPGKTVLIVDVSGSMRGGLSAQSQMDRIDGAAALAAVAREMCHEVVIYATAGNDMTKVHKTALIPARRGMALVAAIRESVHELGGGGIFLTPVCNFVREKEGDADRTIVITDEQDCAAPGKDSPANAEPLGRGYMINVSNNQNGVGYGRKWLHFDGLSDQVIRYIAEYEDMFPDTATQ